MWNVRFISPSLYFFSLYLPQREHWATVAAWCKSGTSRAVATHFPSNPGVQQHSFKAHEGDVLAMTVLPRGRGHTPRHWRRRRKGGRFSRHLPQVSMFTAGKETIPAVSLRLHTHDVLCVAARNLDSPLLRHLSRQRVPVSPAVYLDHSALPAKRVRMEPRRKLPRGWWESCVGRRRHVGGKQPRGAGKNSTVSNCSDFPPFSRTRLPRGRSMLR